MTGAVSGRVAAALLLLFAIVYGIAGWRIEYAFSSDPLGPTAVPILLALFLAGFAIWYAVSPGQAEPWPTSPARRDLVMLVVLAAIATRLIPVLGFPLAISGLSAVVANQFGARWPAAAPIGLAQGFGWWAVFWLLGVALPLWPSVTEAGRLVTNPLGF